MGLLHIWRWAPVGELCIILLMLGETWPRVRRNLPTAGPKHYVAALFPPSLCMIFHPKVGLCCNWWWMVGSSIWHQQTIKCEICPNQTAVALEKYLSQTQRWNQLWHTHLKSDLMGFDLDELIWLFLWLIWLDMFWMYGLPPMGLFYSSS